MCNHARDMDGRVVRDWIAANHATGGFWELVRQRYDATQIIWECKNYEDLDAADFQQASYYMTDAIGRFVISAFRGEEKKKHYYGHIRRIAQDSKGIVLLHLVVAVTDCAEHAEELARQGLQTFVADVSRPETLAELPAAETVLFAVGYDPRGGRSRREVYVDGLRNVLDTLPAGTGRFLFISSTGVYGDAGGQWVDEDWPCRPTSDAGQALLAAEGVLQSHRLGPRGIILRLAGLYGPGRLPALPQGDSPIFVERKLGRPPLVGSGAAVPVAAESVVNLIHVDDAAAVVAAERARPPRTYLVSDGHPIRRHVSPYLAEIWACRRRDSAIRPRRRRPRPRRRGGKNGSATRGCWPSWASSWPIRVIARA